MLLQAPQLFAHLGAQLRIEIAQGLVKQKRLGFADERARDRHALLLSTRQARRRPIREMRHLDDFERLRGAARDLRLAQPATLERVGDVLEHVHVRPDRVGLEHHAEVAPVRGHKDVRLGLSDNLIANADRA